MLWVKERGSILVDNNPRLALRFQPIHTILLERLVQSNVMKCLQSSALAVTLFVTSCWLVAQSSAWKPRNELQRSAELARLSLELNFLEVIQVHYSPLSKDEKQQMTQKQAVDAAEGTRLMKKFAANVREAIADKRCSTSCQGQIGPLINDFSRMADTIQRLNQGKVDSSLLPMYRETFELQLKNTREYIQRINLIGDTSSASTPAK